MKRFISDISVGKVVEVHHMDTDKYERTVVYGPLCPTKIKTKFSPTRSTVPR
jgi:hypothetical protein